MDDRGERQRRLDRARTLGQAELAVAFAAPVLTGFLYVAAPQWSSGMSRPEPLLVSLMPWLGIIGVVVGIVWMIRIYRADSEPVEPTWRYRDF